MTANAAATAVRPADPCCLVIFGASGDLTRRLLVPALYNLAAAGLLADGFCVIGVGRTPVPSEAFRDHLEKGLREFATQPVDGLTVFKVPVGVDGEALLRKLEKQYGFKLAWLARLATYLADRCSPNDEVAVCGDFNVAPEDRDVWDPAATSGGTHVSEPERRALRTLVDWGLEDVFRRHVPEGSVFSWWDYRAGDFHQGRGMRIDLVLLSAAPARRTTAVYIDRNARKKSPGANKPSDHAPVVVDLADH